MANRYPLIIDAADKKLKELPISDNLRVDGDIITQGNLIGDVIGDVTGTLTGDVTGTLTGDVTGNLIGDVTGNLIGDVTGNVTGNLIGDVIGNVTGNVFADNGTLLVNSANGTISYNILINTPFIPTDISELTDIQGLLGDGSTINGGANTFLDLIDTPNAYSFSANKFLKVNNDETALVYGEILQNDIELALGFTPYDSSNPLGFITEENDTLQSVTERGNTTNVALTLSDITTSNSTTTDQFIRNNINFFNFDQTNQFNITIESNKILSLGGRLNIDTSANNVSIINASLVGSGVASIGTESNFWSSAYIDALNVELIRSKNNVGISVFTERGVEVTLGSEPLGAPPTSIIPQSFDPGNKFKISGIGTFQLPTMTTVERDTLTPEVGDMIYNFDASSVQIYVAITDWTQDPEGPGGTPGFQSDAIPGWIDLYTPPDPPGPVE